MLVQEDAQLATIWHRLNFPVLFVRQSCLRRSVIPVAVGQVENGSVRRRSEDVD